MLIDHLNGPLCPQSLPPQSPEHIQYIDLINRAYDAADKNEDGEMVNLGAAKMYDAIAHDGMRLYREEWNGSTGRRPIAVESFYWRCQVCGFVLPATGTARA